MYNWAKIVECKGMQVLVTKNKCDDGREPSRHFIDVRIQTEEINGGVKFHFKHKEQVDKVFDDSEKLNTAIESVVNMALEEYEKNA